MYHQTIARYISLHTKKGIKIFPWIWHLLELWMQVNDISFFTLSYNFILHCLSCDTNAKYRDISLNGTKMRYTIHSHLMFTLTAMYIKAIKAKYQLKFIEAKRIIISKTHFTLKMKYREHTYLILIFWRLWGTRNKLPHIFFKRIC